MEWIKVQNKLPENEQKIIYSGDGFVMMGFYFLGQFTDCMSPHKQIDGITHWMPLPNPPLNN